MGRRSGMDRMTLAGALERRGVRAAYVAGAGVLVAGLLLLTQAALVPGWIALIVVVAYLGPLGLAALLLLAVPAVLVLGSPPPALGFLGVAVAVGVAALNVAILRRWGARPAGGPRDADGGSWSRGWDTVLGAAVFVLAGCAFVLFSLIAGFAALTAHGIDVRVPEAEAHRTLLRVALTWWPALATAIAGLVLWIVQASRGRRILPWAVADLLLILALFGAMILALGWG